MKYEDKRTKVNEDGAIVELVPPEGGWGYMICVSFVVLYISVTGTNSCFGLLYNDFLDSMKQGTSVVTTMQSVVMGTVSIAATLTAVALKRYSIRQVALVAASVGTLSAFLSIFLTSVFQLVFYATIHAVSLGITLPIMYASFNSYFVERRVYMLSICKTFAAAIMMVYPLMIKYLMDQYGFRGALAILCAFGANYFVGALLMQPAEKHFVEKVVSLTIQEDDSTNGVDNTEKNSSFNGIDISKYDPSLVNLLAPSSAREKNLSPTTLEVHAVLKTNLEGEGNIMRNTDKGTMKKNAENGLRDASLSNIGSCESAFVEMNVKSDGKFRAITNFLDLDLLKDWIFVNICIGVSFSFFADFSFNMLLPFMLFHNNYNKEEVAICLTMMASGDFAARIVLVLVSRCTKLKPRNVCYFGAILSFVLRLALNFISAFHPVMVFIFLLGMTKCLMHLMTPLALADHVRLEQFPGAYAIHTVCNGLIATILGPIVGFVRDITDSYNIAFSILTGAFLICIIPWTIEFAIVKKRKILT